MAAVPGNCTACQYDTCPCCGGTGQHPDPNQGGPGFMAALEASGGPGRALKDAAIRESYRPPKNEREAHVHGLLMARGAVVLRRGWPDFAVIENDKIYAVEVKNGTDEFRPEQQLVATALSWMGIDSYLWRGCEHGHNYGFQRVGYSRSWTD